MAATAFQARVAAPGNRPLPHQVQQAQHCEEQRLEAEVDHVLVRTVGEIGHTAHGANMLVHGVHGAEAVNGALDVVTGRTHD